MKRDRFYKVIIIALLVLNFALLGYMWVGNRHIQHALPQHGEPAGFIIERLQLDQNQQLAFEKLKHAHQKASRHLKEESRRLHDALFSSLHEVPDNHTNVDSILLLIAQNDSAKEQLNYSHFKELKTILKPEQYKLYDAFIEDIARRFGPPQGPHSTGRPPRDE